MDKTAIQRRYDLRNTIHYSLKLNRKTDADIIAVLDKAKSKQAFIKDAIRKVI